MVLNFFAEANVKRVLPRILHTLEAPRSRPSKALRWAGDCKHLITPQRDAADLPEG
jgi:hypothetical protein